MADAERALRAAADAQPGSAATPARKRSEILYRTYQLRAVAPSTELRH